jgi:hypothetical protein
MQDDHVPFIKESFIFFQYTKDICILSMWKNQSVRVCLQIANGPLFEFFSPESTSLCLGNIKRNIAQAKRGALRGKELEERPISNL